MYLWDPIADLDPVTPPNYRPCTAATTRPLVFHEYTHGLTNRLVTDAQGYGALNGPQAGAIDEGTADWYALDYLVGDGSTAYLPDDSDTPDVRMASYEIDGPTGLRTQPIDCLTGQLRDRLPERRRRRRCGRVHLRRLREDPRRGRAARRRRDLGPDALAAARAPHPRPWPERRDHEGGAARDRTACGSCHPTRPSSTCATRSCWPTSRRTAATAG